MVVVMVVVVVDFSLVAAEDTTLGRHSGWAACVGATAGEEAATGGGASGVGWGGSHRTGVAAAIGERHDYFCYGSGFGL